MNRISALHRVTERPKLAGVASDYLEHLGALCKAGVVSGVVIRCRVSGRRQHEHLADQEKLLRDHILRLAWVPVHGCYMEVAPGWHQDRQIQFDAAVERAKQLGPGTVVVAETADRFLRHREYRSDRELEPTIADYERLLERANGVPLATLLGPDAPSTIVKKYQQARPEALKHVASDMETYKPIWAAHGCCRSAREIARVLGVARTTARRWLKEWVKDA